MGKGYLALYFSWGFTPTIFPFAILFCKYILFLVFLSLLEQKTWNSPNSTGMMGWENLAKQFFGWLYYLKT